MKAELITLPSQYPITLAEAKKQAEIDDTDTSHDVYIKALIQASTAQTEQYLHRRLVTQTWKYYSDWWPSFDFFRLPFGRLNSVTSVKYTDSDGDQSTLSSADYIVDTKSQVGQVVLGYDEVWPTVTLYPNNPIEVEFICGYYIGDTWVKETAYTTEQVMPVTENGLVYNCTAAGTTAATEPTWPLTIGSTVVDGTATWTCIGIAVPAPIRHAIKLTVADLFEYRETDFFGGTYEKLKTWENLIHPYKLYGGIIESW